jgi:hypothetical protein
VPPATTVSTSKDFIVAMTDPLTAVKVQLFTVRETDQGTDYSLNTTLVTGDTTRADGFLYTPSRFVMPVGLTYQFGTQNNIFVVDEALDSLYIFSSQGLEGVNPPATSQSRKWIKVSFGGRGQGPMQFDRPTAVAFQNRNVFVCDRGNKRISRFRLSTDFL